MRQLTQKLKNGQMKVIEVPVPVCQKRQILIQNHYSLISAGTEMSNVTAARKGYLGKAKERPQQVKQVFETLKKQGVEQTYRAVMKKLDAYSSLGYSCAGKVIAVGSDVEEFRVGDYAAAGGFTASHSEIVKVPVNLCTKLEQSADLKQAAYNTLGAIAMQGVRQADLRLGEICAVIGLGLIGQLTGLLLKASGVRVVGIDVDTDKAKRAQSQSADKVFTRDEQDIEEKILKYSDSLGCDAVIITAATDSLDPVNFAGAIARKNGAVVVVGAVPTGFSREPHYYKKELQLKMSCSYGPGRYDPVFEEKGIDYPHAYVRWTEKRNMHAFQSLIYENKIKLSFLTTHTFSLEEASDAYDMMMAKTEPYLGILIQYDASKKHSDGSSTILSRKTTMDSDAISIGFIGAGSYAQSHLLPNIHTSEKVQLNGVMTSSSTSSRSVAERFSFNFCTCDENEIIANHDINTVFIVTRHNTHADYVKKALRAGKNIFVEKPLCLNIADLAEIKGLMEDLVTQKEPVPHIMVGYNRRFSPLARIIKENFGSGSYAMNYRINAGYIPQDSWSQDIETGGGRIVGEVCHFIDFLTFINGSLPVSVYANSMHPKNTLSDILNVNLAFENGSIGNISYFSNGDAALTKERVEIFSNGSAAVIDDFKSLDIYTGGKRKSKKLMVQDKGQKTEIKTFINNLLGKESSSISFDEIHRTSLTTFKIIESIQKNKVLTL